MDVLVAAYDEARSRIAAPCRSRARAPRPPRRPPAAAAVALVAGTRSSRAPRRRRPPAGGLGWDPAASSPEWQARAHADGDPLERAACRALARIVNCAADPPRPAVGDARDDRATRHRPRVQRRRAAIASARARADAARGRAQRRLPRAAAAAAPGRDEHQGPVRVRQEHAAAAADASSRPRSASTGAEFALISPDIWRKQLLDYGSLGDAYKYAGAFTGEEVALIDHKLDRYMAKQGARAAG